MTVQASSSRAWPGWCIVGIGAIHTLFGILVYSQGWTQIAGRQFLNAVDGDVVREHAFWFTFAGPLLILLGVLMLWIARHANLPLPRFLGWSFLAIAGLAGLLMPVSGFWLLIPPGIALIRRGEGPN